MCEDFFERFRNEKEKECLHIEMHKKICRGQYCIAQHKCNVSDTNAMSAKLGFGYPWEVFQSNIVEGKGFGESMTSVWWM